jgi:hypothetical protein
MRRVFVTAVAVVLALATLPAFGGGRPLTASLDASQEVPPVASDGVASAQLGLNQGRGMVCFSIEWSDLSGPVVAAHIHPGEAGVNNAPLVGFHGPPFGPEFGPIDSPLEGCVDAPRDVIKDIRQNPHAYYLNLHTAEFPGGEVRGQLSK